MNTEPEEKGQWQVGAEGLKLNDDTIAELRKYESQYNRILNQGMDLTYQRNFQIGLFILLTVCVLGMGYSSPNAPYSYLLSLLVIAIQWYIFYLYDKLRKILSTSPIEDGALAYFRHKRDILLEVVYLRKITIVNSIFIFLFIWANKSPDKLFNTGSLTLLGFVGLVLVGGFIHYRIKISPVVAYLKGLVQHLETENIEIQQGS